MASTAEPFPFPLPVVKKAWLDANGGAARQLAEAIYKDKSFGQVHALADALERAGCDDQGILAHLRGHPRWRDEACWHGTCWVVNHLLGHAQAVAARFHWGNGDCEALVINPGDWFGEPWLVWEDGLMSPPLYVVEADHAADAEDEFVESDYGKGVRIEYGTPEAKDYGFEANPGDQIRGLVIDRKCWVNLDGEVVDKELTPCSTTGNGTDYDSQSVHLADEHAMKGLLYFGPGLPPEGVKPVDFDPSTCDNCKEHFYVTASWADKNFCSPRCRLHWDRSPVRLATVCPACDRYVDPVDDPDLSLVNVGFHFPHYAGSDYALPADGPDDVYLDGSGEVAYRVCEGSGKLGRVETAEEETKAT